MEKQNLIQKLKDLGGQPLFGLRGKPAGIRWRSNPVELNREQVVVYETIDYLDWYNNVPELQKLTGDFEDEIFAYEIKNDKMPQAVVMHPGTMKKMFFTDNNLRHQIDPTSQELKIFGILILRSFDLEEGKFILI
jgi:hypothetical protein